MLDNKGLLWLFINDPLSLTIAATIFWVLWILISFIGYYEKWKIVNSWMEGAASIGGNLTFAIVSVVWASTVSVFGNELKEELFGKETLTMVSFFFLNSVYLAVFLGTLISLHRKKVELDNQTSAPPEALSVASKSIIELQQEFRRCLSDWDNISNEISTLTHDEAKDFEDNLVDAKKGCLSALLDVANAWNGRAEFIGYKANLLNIIDSNDVSKLLHSQGPISPLSHGSFTFSSDAIENSPFFLFSNSTQSKIERCDYLLVNEQDLSVSLNYGEREESNHFPICLPFSLTRKNPATNKLKQPNFIGAPLALQLEQPYYVSSTTEKVNAYIESLKSNKSYANFVDRNFVNSIHKYYEDDSAGSLISVPLNTYAYNEAEQEWYRQGGKHTCILNVYANQEHLFTNNDVVQSYILLVKPICHMLAVLISLRLKWSKMRKQVKST
ncbi:hypothetical protein ACHE4N_000329 [Vibrio parahaemolyticus]|nr:hypothetical protein [Vibrio parahaemolyticus]EIU6780826.1 hypothetical protein [Vibrio parahaemolyticus]